MRITIFLLIIFIANLAFSQDSKIEKKIKRTLNAEKIIWDKHNKEGVFIAQSAKTGKWGMFEYFKGLKRPTTLIFMQFDSLGFYDYAPYYTVVKEKDKYGVIAGPWTGKGYPKHNIDYIYESIKHTHGDKGILAAKGNGLWGFVDAKSGDTLIPFVHKSFADLPHSHPIMRKYPMSTFPEALQKIIDDPASITDINLSGLGLTYLPNAIGACANAKTANLENNHLFYLPERIFNLNGLEVLLLGGNPNFIKFSKNFSKLTSLKVLYIGTVKGKERFSYSSKLLEFSDDLGKMTNLEQLVVFGHFHEKGFPKFIYNLPNLKSLSLLAIFGNNYKDLDLGKLKCRDSLRYLKIETTTGFTNMNENMKFFPKLEKVEIQTYKHKESPLWIKDLKALRYVSIIYLSPSKQNKKRYVGATALLAYGKFYPGEIMTYEERNKALWTWDNYMKTLGQ